MVGAIGFGVLFVKTLYLFIADKGCFGNDIGDLCVDSFESDYALRGDRQNLSLRIDGIN